MQNIIERRKLRDLSNIFELPSTEFIKNFRLNKEAFKMVLDIVSFKDNKRITGVPATLQLAATLNVLASGGYQFNIDTNKLLSMAQTTVSKVFKYNIKILENNLCHTWIRLKEENFSETREFFFSNHKIPGVIGIVDGTHIPILKPTENEHAFFNRKGFHSINVMIVSNHLYEILGIDPRNGGAAHDSAIWNKSDINKYLHDKYEEEEICLRILGDSGYPLLPWCLTPYRNASEGSSEMHFNNVHAKARSQVERTIGLLKTRWRCLCSDRKLRYHPEKVATIINVCAALHNICVKYKIQTEPIERESTIREASTIDEILIEANEQHRAKMLRDSIKTSL